jgi:hypothetical protein
MERFRVIFKKNGTPAIQGALTGSLANLLRDGFRGSLEAPAIVSKPIRFQ